MPMADRALLVDYGGVLTTSLRESFEAFCEAEGIEHARLRELLRHAYNDGDSASIIAMVETGQLEVGEFERRLALMLAEGLHATIAPEGMIQRMLAGVTTDEVMVEAVRRAHAAGITTALLSNSWGLHYYPYEMLGELFDDVVISGEVGLRKPHPEIFLLAAERVGLSTSACVFIDDFGPNVEAAERVGMRGVVHEEAGRTVKELEAILGLPLRAGSDLD